MVTVYICENAHTLQFHTERDCAYTMILSPICDYSLNKQHNYVFEFQLNINNNILQIHLEKGTVLYYNGYGINHRQVPLKCDSKDVEFWNLSCYANKRFFSNVMASLKRLIPDNIHSS